MKVFILLGKRTWFDKEKQVINVYSSYELAKNDMYLGDIIQEKEVINDS